MHPDPPGTAAEIFGLTLRQLRAQAGLSLRELGKRSLYGYTRLSRAERGEILIPEAQVRALDDVLQAGGLLVALRRGAGAPSVPGVLAGHCSVTGSGPVILEAGRASTAVTILGNTITATSSSLARDRGHLTAKLAVAITRTSQPDPGRAAGLGLEALRIARDTGSARIIRELRTLDNQLQTHWASHPPSRNLHDALVTRP